MKTDLDVNGTLRQVFETYRDQAGVLLPIAFWLGLFLAIVNELAGSSSALFPVVFVVPFVIATLYEGMVVGLVREVQEGRRDSSVRDLVNFAIPVLLPLVAAGFLYAIGVFVGFVLLIVPGLILLTIWAVIAPVIVVERTGAIAAFSRSRELVSGNGWRVFGVIVVTTLIAVLAFLAFDAIATAIANGPIVHVVLGAIASTFTAPVEGLVAAVLYFRLLAIERSAPSPQPAAPSVLEQPGDGQG